MTTLDLPQRTTSGYGWRRDIPDLHDAVLGVEAITHPLPDTVDLAASPNMPPVYNQLNLGACTAHGVKAIVEYDNHLQTDTFYDPSRLFIYYCERYMEDTVDTDSGAQVRDGLKVVNKVGNIKESVWPYDVSTFATPPEPLTKLAHLAEKDRVLKYARVPQNETAMRSVLAGPNGNDGRPIVFGFTVYESFEQDIGSDGIMPLPKRGEKILGGHCVVHVGYCEIKGAPYFKVRNSWDTTWGDEGYFYMPLSFAINPSLASDLWVAYTTNDKAAA